MRNWHAVNQPRLFSKPLLQSILPIAERRGVAASSLLKNTSVLHSAWQQSNHRISLADWYRVTQNAEHQVKDNQLWPLVAQSMIQQRLSPLAELTLHAHHFFDVLKQLQYFRQLLQPLEFGAARWHGDYLDIYLLPSFGRIASNSYLSISLLVTIAQLRGLDVQQWQLRLPSNIPPLPQWSRWFDKISDGALVSIRIPRQQLQQRLLTDSDHYRQAQAFCRIQQREATTPSALTHTLLWTYRRLHRQEQISINELATHLQLSVSSCKRVLTQHGSHFQQCVDTMRLFRMVELLQAQPYNNSQLAEYLGYSNSNNLRRACKRWLGENPDRLRQILA